MKRILFALNFTFVMFVSAMIVGCAGGDMPDLGTVTGKVTLDGKPVPKANIQFYPAEGGRASYAVSEDDGSYTLIYKGDVEGAKVGQHIVSVSTAGDSVGEPGDEDYKPGKEETIPEKYRGESELKKEVKAGANEINLDLKG